MYKAVISDFDGTLASKEGVVSPLVRESVKKLISRGFYFSIATGKSYQGIIENICHELNLNTPVIVRSGAEIVDPKTGNVIMAEFLDTQEIDPILDYLKNQSIAFEVNIGDFVYTNSQDLLGSKSYKKYKDLGELPHDYLQTVSKIRLVMDEKQVETFKPHVEKMLKQFRTITIVQIPRGFDVTSEKATKHLAVLKLMKHLGITAQQTVGIGDGYNDYPLLEAVSYKVAMENAPQELKDIADFIAPPVSKNGVAVVINKLLK